MPDIVTILPGGGRFNTDCACAEGEGNIRLPTNDRTVTTANALLACLAFLLARIVNMIIVCCGISQTKETGKEGVE